MVFLGVLSGDCERWLPNATFPVLARRIDRRLPDASELRVVGGSTATAAVLVSPSLEPRPPAVVDVRDAEQVASVLEALIEDGIGKLREVGR